MELKFYFDVGSPYSKVALEIAERYAPLWGTPLRILPVSAGALLKATGNHSPVSVRAKGEYAHLDLSRNVHYAKVAFKGLPSNFGSSSWNTLPALRLLTAAGQHFGSTSKELLELTHTIFDAIFVQHAGCQFLFDQQTLEQCCKDAGLSAADSRILLAASQTTDIKDMLKARTAEVLEEGAFGVPDIVVDGHPDLPRGKRMFFGSDRFEQIAALIGKPWMGPCPPTARL